MTTAALTITLILVFVFAVLLVVNFFIAKEFYKAAAMKGWNSRKYFWIAFLLPLAGYILVADLPDRGGRADMAAIECSDLPEL